MLERLPSNLLVRSFFLVGARSAASSVQVVTVLMVPHAPRRMNATAQVLTLPLFPMPAVTANTSRMRSAMEMERISV